MKEVIYIKEPEKAEEKPVEFTHLLTNDCGWSETELSPKEFKKVVYLGNDDADGDIFACYGNYIHIYKGHLNSGKY